VKQGWVEEINEENMMLVNKSFITAGFRISKIKRQTLFTKSK
jgi:hypothetical protein